MVVFLQEFKKMKKAISLLLLSSSILIDSSNFARSEQITIESELITGTLNKMHTVRSIEIIQKDDKHWNDFISSGENSVVDYAHRMSQEKNHDAVFYFLFFGGKKGYSNRCATDDERKKIYQMINFLSSFKASKVDSIRKSLVSSDSAEYRAVNFSKFNGRVASSNFPYSVSFTNQENIYNLYSSSVELKINSSEDIVQYSSALFSYDRNMFLETNKRAMEVAKERIEEARIEEELEDKKKKGSKSNSLSGPDSNEAELGSVPEEKEKETEPEPEQKVNLNNNNFESGFLDDNNSIAAFFQDREKSRVGGSRTKEETTYKEVIMDRDQFLESFSFSAPKDDGELDQLKKQIVHNIYPASCSLCTNAQKVEYFRLYMMHMYEGMNDAHRSSVHHLYVPFVRKAMRSIEAFWQMTDKYTVDDIFDTNI